MSKFNSPEILRICLVQNTLCCIQKMLWTVTEVNRNTIEKQNKWNKFCIANLANSLTLLTKARSQLFPIHFYINLQNIDTISFVSDIRAGL